MKVFQIQATQTMNGLVCYGIDMHDEEEEDG